MERLSICNIYLIQHFSPRGAYSPIASICFLSKPPSSDSKMVRFIKCPRPVTPRSTHLFSLSTLCSAVVYNHNNLNRQDRMGSGLDAVMAAVAPNPADTSPREGTGTASSQIAPDHTKACRNEVARWISSTGQGQCRSTLFVGHNQLDVADAESLITVGFRRPRSRLLRYC